VEMSRLGRWDPPPAMRVLALIAGAAAPAGFPMDVAAFDALNRDELVALLEAYNQAPGPGAEDVISLGALLRCFLAFGP
jgi:hypothetical protein